MKNTIKVELDFVRKSYLIEPGPDQTGIYISTGFPASEADKKNFAQLLSSEIGRRVANELRFRFPGILPNAEGKGLESRAKTAKGYKKLDVNYSTPELGLGLGVSIKTLNFRDQKSRRYTKNFTRIDNELRAEASDYHERQPYAVLCGILFLPLDSCFDQLKTSSSFGQCVQVLRHRTGRRDPKDSPNLLERLYIALYETDPQKLGELVCFDASNPPPKVGTPEKNALTLDQVFDAIWDAFNARNNPDKLWEDVPDRESELDEVSEITEEIANEEDNSE